LGVAYEAAGRFDEAERAYLDAVARDPLLYGAYNNLAFMCAQRKVKLDEALKWAQRANDLAPRSGTVRDTLGWVYRARGDLTKAARTIEEAARLSPDDATIQYHLGIVYSELGRKPESVAALKRALALSPNFRQAADARQRLQELGSN
jgi:tetratricopeptide (TPR) repeat protein